MWRAALLLLCMTAAASANEPLAALGKALATVNCATCHAIDVSGNSPMSDAPPFRNIALNYSPDELEDAFNDGVATEHPAMPDWQVTPEQAAALTAYIMSLAAHGVKKTEATP
jgi:cytochrome c